MTLLAPRLPDSETYLVKWGKLYGASPALAIAEAAAIASGPLIVIAPSSRDAESLSDEIGFFWDGGAAKTFPDLETLPYDGFSAHPDITSARLAAWRNCRAPAPASGSLRSIPAAALAPRSYIEAYSLQGARRRVARSRRTARATDRGRLRGGHAGRRARRVRGPRLTARRFSDGLGIPSAHRHARPGRRQHPALRSRHPALGRQLERVDLLPARETPLNPDAVREFRRRYRLRFPGDLSEQMIYRDVSQGIASGGIEYFLPLFFERTSHLFEYLPPNSVLIDVNDACASAGRFGRASCSGTSSCATTATGRFSIRASCICRPQSSEQLGAWRQVQLHQFEWPPETGGRRPEFRELAPAAVRIDARADSRPRSSSRISKRVATRVLLAAESAGRRELLLELLRGRGISRKCSRISRALSQATRSSASPFPRSSSG
jgi:transcription-repair coupling factor (superfamily II helicase)